MQRLEVSGAVRPIYGSLGVKWLRVQTQHPEYVIIIVFLRQIRLHKGSSILRYKFIAYCAFLCFAFFIVFCLLKMHLQST